jgi:chromosome segregation ATPase
MPDEEKRLEFWYARSYSPVNKTVNFNPELRVPASNSREQATAWPADDDPVDMEETAEETAEETRDTTQPEPDAGAAEAATTGESGAAAGTEKTKRTTVTAVAKETDSLRKRVVTLEEELATVQGELAGVKGELASMAAKIQRLMPLLNSA